MAALGVGSPYVVRTPSDKSFIHHCSIQFYEQLLKLFVFPRTLSDNPIHSVTQQSYVYPGILPADCTFWLK